MKYYHYTPEFRLPEFFNTQVIKLATASVSSKNEKAVAWVSTNPHWENTATKDRYDLNGNRVHLTFEQQVESFGCARIEVKPTFKLYNWNHITKLAKTPKGIVKNLETVGIRRGAKPSEWYGSLKPIPMEQWIRIEQFIDGKWFEVYNFETQTQRVIDGYEISRINY